MESLPAFHLTYEGKEYKFDLEEITLEQARTMKARCGLTLMGLEAGLGEGDPEALRAVFWLMLTQNGEPQADIDRVNFKIVKFARAFDAAQPVEDEKAEAPKGKSSPA